MPSADGVAEDEERAGSARKGQGAVRLLGAALITLAASVLTACAAQRPTYSQNAAIVVMAVISEPGLKNEGRISGKIVDASQQPIVGSTVKIVGPTLRGFAGATTDAEGKFMTCPLPPGLYSIQIEAAGYRTSKPEEILVCAGRHTRLKCTLSGKSDFTMADDWPWIKPHSTTTGAVISQGENGQVYVDPH